MIILRSPANSQCEFAPNSQYCEFQAEFAANSRCERIRSEFGEFKWNSLRICIPSLGHLYALSFEAHPDGTMRTRVCETGGAGYAEVEYTCTYLGTLFEGVPGSTKMPPVHF